MNNNLVFLVAWSLVCLAARIALAADEPPFVAAFDRFFARVNEPSAAGGRLLLSELSCTACHASGNIELTAKAGPALNGVGNRVRADWQRRFLRSPQSEKPGTTMPNVLHGLRSAEKTGAINALVAFLATQQQPFPVLNSTGGNPIAFEFWKSGDAKRGATLYHQVGCVACHEPDAEYAATPQVESPLEKLITQLDPEELQELGLTDAATPVRSVPHGSLAAKYTRESLTHFLRGPEKIRPSGRMPSLQLKPEEASDIAAYLLHRQRDLGTVALTSPDEALVAKGKTLFGEYGCANCHTAQGIRTPPGAKKLAELDLKASANCVNAPSRVLPRYPLSDKQRVSLLASITQQQAMPFKSIAGERVAFRMMQLNCYACHERDQRGGVGPNRRAFFETVRHVDLGDEGRIPPTLSGVGAKLQVAWLKKVFEGTGNVRPHLRARMPKFAAGAVGTLPELLAEADLETTASSADVFSETEALADVGRSLMDAGCVQCHPFRGERMPGVIGVDLAGVTDRIQPRWLHDFLLNPARLKPRTRMPTFFPDGRSANQTVLGGDVEQQLNAMWAYLKDLPKQKLPEKIIQGKEHNFELVPKDRPILLRTFMEEAGLHAIAVGFPQKVHFAFDAENVRVAQAWRGRFIDAHGTWFDRFVPLAKPLGTDVISFPPGVPFAKLKDADAKWPTDEEAGYQFLGYRLSKNGFPTFLYRYGQFDIEDQMVPSKANSFVRRFRITIPKKDDQPAEGGSKTLAALQFRANVGKRLTREDRPRERLRSATNEARLMVSMSRNSQILAFEADRLRQQGDLTEWLIDVPFASRTETLEVIYTW